MTGRLPPHKIYTYRNADGTMDELYSDGSLRPYENPFDIVIPSQTVRQGAVELYSPGSLYGPQSVAGSMHSGGSVYQQSSPGTPGSDMRPLSTASSGWGSGWSRSSLTAPFAPMTPPGQLANDGYYNDAPTPTAPSMNSVHRPAMPVTPYRSGDQGSNMSVASQPSIDKQPSSKRKGQPKQSKQRERAAESSVDPTLSVQTGRTYVSNIWKDSTYVGDLAFRMRISDLNCLRHKVTMWDRANWTSGGYEAGVIPSGEKGDDSQPTYEGFRAEAKRFQDQERADREALDNHYKQPISPLVYTGYSHSGDGFQRAGRPTYAPDDPASSNATRPAVQTSFSTPFYDYEQSYSAVERADRRGRPHH